ncbi:MAG: histidine kinase [Bryobacteraceae bacterium]|jgi:two-component sensor histidine kinase
MNTVAAGGYAQLGHGASLLNMGGHCVGVLLFGIFLFLLVRDRAGSRLRGSGLAFAAAGLAFAWNLGALLLIAMPPGWPGLSSVVEFLGFSSLSLLAPVLLHLSLNHRCPLAVAGYLTGAGAVGLYLADAILHRPEYHLYALSLMAVGLGSVTLVSAVHLAVSSASDRRGRLRQVLGTGLLLIFIGTYVHLGWNQGAHAAWPQELVLHHASVPLALFIILHNHRFVLLDALIRFCANVLLVALFAFACLKVIHAGAGSTGAASQGALALAVCLLFLLFAFAREAFQRLLTRIVFRRGDSSMVARELRSKASELKEEAAYLAWALDRIARFMGADRIRAGQETLAAKLQASGITAPALYTDLPDLRKPLEDLGVEAIVPLRFSGTEVSFLLLGRRPGGRPYLSEDLRHLGQFASIVADHVQTLRESELRRLAARAELRALQAQINPHFLFNALNTLYGLVPRQAAEARAMVVSLADVFRYFLKNEETTILLEEELRIVEAYLQIETLRLGAKLRKEIQVDPEALRVPIPILSIQPLVENAVKHGIAPQAAGGLVRLEARVSDGGVNILVEDTGSGFGTGDPESITGAGVGLQNVARRLRLTYGPAAELKIGSGRNGTSVSFTIPVARAAALLQ